MLQLHLSVQEMQMMIDLASLGQQGKSGCVTFHTFLRIAEMTQWYWPYHYWSSTRTAPTGKGSWEACMFGSTKLLLCDSVSKPTCSALKLFQLYVSSWLLSVHLHSYTHCTGSIEWLFVLCMLCYCIVFSRECALHQESDLWFCWVVGQFFCPTMYSLN